MDICIVVLWVWELDPLLLLFSLFVHLSVFFKFSFCHSFLRNIFKINIYRMNMYGQWAVVLCIVILKTGLVVLILPFNYPFFFLFPILDIEILYYTSLRNSSSWQCVVYCGIENRASCLHSNPYLYSFLVTMSARIFNLGIQMCIRDWESSSLH